MSKGPSIATPKDFKDLDDDQIDRIPHALIGILVEGCAYGLASVDVRRKWLVPNNGNRRKRLQARFREVGIGLTIEEATEENDQAIPFPQLGIQCKACWGNSSARRRGMASCEARVLET